MMIAIVDVDYRETGAYAACVLIKEWADADAVAEHVAVIKDFAEYEPGQFYKRELPCIFAVLSKLSAKLNCVVVDGYVWLSEKKDPGLGAHLYESLKRTVPVIGIAKTRFASADAREVLRGQATRPIYVTSVGIDVDDAAANVSRMHGPHRIPAMLKRVDKLARNTSGE